MKISSRILLSTLLLTFSYKSYSSAATQKYECVSQKEDDEFAIDPNLGPAPLLTLHDLTYDITAYKTQDAQTDSKLKTLTANYFATIITTETSKLKQPAHPKNVQQTIQTASEKLKKAVDLKKKFTDRYRALTAKRHAEQDLDDESVDDAASKRFDTLADIARDNVSSRLLGVKCAIL